MSATNWTKRTFTDGIILSPNTTPAVNPTSGVQVYAKADNKLYTLNSSGVEQAVGSGGSIVLVTQVSHGFTSADVGRPLYLNSSTYALARADVETTAEVAGLLNKVVDSNSIEVCLSGEVSSVGANLISGGGSLVPGEVYFLSPTEAGKITTTQPSVVGQVSKPIGIARTTSALDFYNMRGELVGSANAYTQIALSNNATTTIQNAAAYDSVELNGWIFINATIKYRYLFKAQVTKKGDGTDYLVSFQHSGDTPPDGFNISVTTAGLVQVTLPSLSGFSSAIAQFNLNGPAVGVSLPLQINSSLITLNAGIQFPASPILSSNANNLDDYKEGVFAPYFYGSTTTGTWTPNPTAAGGYFIKIGKLVYIFMNLSGSLSGAAGNLLIGNMPYPRAASNAQNAWNTPYSALTMSYSAGLTWTANHFCPGWLIDTSSVLYAHTTPVGGGTPGNVPVSNGTLNVHIAGAYYTD